MAEPAVIEPVKASEDPSILTTPPAALTPTPDQKLFVEQPTSVPKIDPQSSQVPDPVKATTPEVKPAVVEPPKEPTKAIDPDPAKPADATTTTPKPGEEYDLKAPEGSLLTAEEVAEIKARKLPKEQAEAEVKTYGDMLQKRADREKQTLDATKKQWYESCKTDPIIGGDKFAENAELAKRGFQSVADAEVTAFMRASGLDNHPMAVRMFAKLGRMFAEDKIIPGSAGKSETKRNPEDILFGNPQSTAELH